MGVVAVAVVLFLIMGALAGLLGGDGGSDADDARGEGDPAAIEPLPEGHPALALARRDADDPLALGDPDAPVVMIEYSDFQCAFCAMHARGTRVELIDEYVEQGLLRIEFRNFPINGPESDAAARAAWAAGQQGRFWEFYEVAFAQDTHMDSGKYSEEGLRELAEEAGVPDVEALMVAMESEEAGEAVGRDAEEAMDLGVVSPPSFLLNGHPLRGARPVEEFRDTIDQLLEAADE